METKQLILDAIFEGKRTKYSISDKFAYIVKGNFESFIDYVNKATDMSMYKESRRNIRERFKKADREAMVSFYSDGTPSDIRIEGINQSGNKVELFIKIDDETGEAFHWGIKSL